MKFALGLALLFFPLLLWAQVSDVPSAQLLVEQGLGRIEESRFEEALLLFRQAREVDPENAAIERYIVSLERMVTLEGYRADAESIDRFIEEREAEKEEETNKAPAVQEENADFITQEQNKEKARQDRAQGALTVKFPFLHSSNGDSRVDSDLRRTGDVLQGVSYGLSYFPDFFNRTIGVEGVSGSMAMVINDELVLNDEVMIGFVLRNYFNEQPGSYSLLGTHFNVGLFFQENLDAELRRLLNFFRFEVFFRDPLLYRLIKSRPFRSVAFDGNFQFTLVDDTYMLGYGGGVTLTMGSRLEISGNLIYRNYMLDSTLYPSWTSYVGLNYSFR